MSYFLWGCRGILTLFTLRSERVNCCFACCASIIELQQSIQNPTVSYCTVFVLVSLLPHLDRVFQPILTMTVVLLKADIILLINRSWSSSISTGKKKAQNFDVSEMFETVKRTAKEISKDAEKGSVPDKYDNNVITMSTCFSGELECAWSSV